MKKTLALFTAAALAASAFAYNPPHGGEQIYRLTSPEMLGGSAASASGGPSLTIVPTSTVINPAIPALQDRVCVNLDGTVFLNSDKDDMTYTDPVTDEEVVIMKDESTGFGFSTGVIYPTRFANFTLACNGVFSNMLRMPVGNVVDTRAGISKEVNDWLSVGAGLYYTMVDTGDLADDSDFGVGADFGILCKVGELGPFKNSRIGLSLVNIGKPAKALTLGFDDDKESTMYPSILTAKAGFGADIFTVGKWMGSASADVSVPFFQNAIIEAGFQMMYDDRLSLNASTQFNTREFIEDGIDASTFGISLGATFKFGIKASNPRLNGSDITPGLATQIVYENIEAVTTGVKFELGPKDEGAAEITIF